MSGRWRRGVAVVGAVAALVAVAFLARTVASSWEEVRAAVSDADVVWFVPAVAAAAAGMVAIAFGWWLTLRALGATLALRTTIARYFVGEIGKYLPGSLWPIVGRGELAHRAGTARPIAYGSVAVSLLTLYLAAGLLVSGLVPFLGRAEGGAPLWPLLSVPVGVALLGSGVLDRLRRIVERLVRRDLDVRLPSPGDSARLVAGFVPAWCLIGLSTWAMARALDPDVDLLPVVAAAVLSWLAGFVAVPVPGGVGVREAVFVAAVAQLSSPIATTVAIASRLVFVLVDALGWALGSAWLAMEARRRRSVAAEVTSPPR